ncbi:MAG TPA: flagellar basal body L-ring protein FlgH [Rhodobacteraceae bacterium]|nr:flagellar basal body L-ring protein FlgH [Paracoccaceae bacterium]
MRIFFLLVSTLFLAAACSRVADIGQAPSMSPITEGAEFDAMAMSASFPQAGTQQRSSDRASLWRQGRSSLLGDHRAQRAGDILTVVIEIDDKAEISNASQRGRSGSETMGLKAFLGLPEAASQSSGVALDPAVSTNSTSASSGSGQVRRNEKLTLRIAATVVGILPNGVLQISGSQEVRVNFELRELLVTGFVRPEDISRQNEVPYDKIASARISYGGRGQISDVQQPRYGQQVLDIILPF